MPFRRYILVSLASALSPLVSACNQTAAPAQPGSTGTRAIAAINDAQAANASAMAGVAAMGIVAPVISLDPTGVGGMVANQVFDRHFEAQTRAQQESSRKIDIEVERLIAEGEAMQALGEKLERQKQAGASRKPRKPVQ